MTKKICLNNQAWLAEESKAWVADGIISSEQSQAIKSLYQVEMDENIQQTGWAMGILVALGVLLIGGGIILLFAHNWEHLGKGARTVLSFLPLIVAQALCFYTFKSKFNSTGWREAGATLVFMGIASSISLIGQTYHIYGDMERFVLTWFVLGLPLVYLMRSSMVMILLTVLICWLCSFQGKAYWLLFFLLVPYWVYCYKQQRNIAFYWGIWLASLCFVIALCISLAFRSSPLFLYPIMSLMTISAAYYLLGKVLFGFDNTKFWKNPLSSLGAIGIGIFSLALSYADLWSETYHQYYSFQLTPLVYLDAVVFFAALALIIFGLYRYRKQLQLYQMVMTGTGLIGLIAMLHFSQVIGSLVWLSWFFNLFIVVVAGLIIVRSAEQGRMLALNGALLWLALLILIRFFDSDISILWKAAAFIVIGSAFIGVNIWFSRQNKRLAQQEAAND